MRTLYELLKDKPGFKEWKKANHELIYSLKKEEMALSRLRLLDEIAFQFFNSNDQKEIRKKELKELKIRSKKK